MSAIKLNRPAEIMNFIIEEGWHRFTIEEIAEDTMEASDPENKSSKRDQQVIVIKLLVCDGGPSNGLKLTRNMFVEHGGGGSMLKQFLDAVRPDIYAGQDQIEEFDPDDLLGCELEANVVIKEYTSKQDGKQKRANEFAAANPFRAVEESKPDETPSEPETTSEPEPAKAPAKATAGRGRPPKATAEAKGAAAKGKASADDGNTRWPTKGIVSEKATKGKASADDDWLNG